MSPPGAQDRSPLTIFAAFASIGAFLVATLAIVIVATDTSSSGASSASAPVTVTLSEFKIDPGTITVSGTEATLEVVNAGSQVHNLSVVELGATTPDIAGGASATLELTGLEEGKTYTVICTIPGHEAAGMKATLVVGAAGAAGESAAGAGHGSGADHDWAATEKIHSENIIKYVGSYLQSGLKTGVPTEGRGNQKLEPRIEGDFKVFDLETSIIQWEVEPGKFVEAWAYNGMVPGPWIKVEPGDLVRVNVVNNMPAATDIHFHGVTTPFVADGVANLTQPFIAANGGTHTYEFRAPATPEMGMYHAHAHGNVAVVNGLFAVFQVGDMDMSAALGQTINGRTIPNVVPDQQVMVLNDAGTIGLSLNAKSFPATDPYTMKVGQVMQMTYYNEGLQIHPMHLHHVPQLVVAKDGFPLAQPFWADTVNVAPGERWTVLLAPTNVDLNVDINGQPKVADLDLTNLDLNKAVSELVEGRTPAGAGIWAYHCHILNHAENDNGLFGMVTALVVLPENA